MSLPYPFPFFPEQKGNKVEKLLYCLAIINLAEQTTFVLKWDVNPETNWLYDKW